MDLQVTSPAFEAGGLIPKKYTCDAENVSPEIAWSNIPPSAQSIAIISDDPDAPMGTWVHWVYYNLPVSITSLPENVAPVESPHAGGMQGINDFRKVGYGGPCPPGGTHRYFFRVYALDSKLDLRPGAAKAQLLAAMKGHVLAEGSLMGKYNRN